MNKPRCVSPLICQQTLGVPPFAHVFLILLIGWEQRHTAAFKSRPLFDTRLLTSFYCWDPIVVGIGIFDRWGNDVFFKGANGESSRNVGWGSSSSSCTLAAVVLLLFYLSFCSDSPGGSEASQGVGAGCVAAKAEDTWFLALALPHGTSLGPPLLCSGLSESSEECSSRWWPVPGSFTCLWSLALPVQRSTFTWLLLSLRWLWTFVFESLLRQYFSQKSYGDPVYITRSHRSEGFLFVFCCCPWFPQSVLSLCTWLYPRLLSSCRALAFLFLFKNLIALSCHSEISKYGNVTLLSSYRFEFALGSSLEAGVFFSSPDKWMAQSRGLWWYRQALLWDVPEFLSNPICHHFLFKISVLFK